MMAWSSGCRTVVDVVDSPPPSSVVVVSRSSTADAVPPSSSPPQATTDPGPPARQPPRAERAVVRLTPPYSLCRTPSTQLPAARRVMSKSVATLPRAWRPPEGAPASCGLVRAIDTVISPNRAPPTPVSALRRSEIAQRGGQSGSTNRSSRCRRRLARSVSLSGTPAASVASVQVEHRPAGRGSRRRVGRVGQQVGAPLPVLASVRRSAKNHLSCGGRACPADRHRAARRPWGSSALQRWRRANARPSAVSMSLAKTPPHHVELRTGEPPRRQLVELAARLGPEPVVHQAPPHAPAEEQAVGHEQAATSGTRAGGWRRGGRRPRRPARPRPTGQRTTAGSGRRRPPGTRRRATPPPGGSTADRTTATAPTTTTPTTTPDHVSHRAWNGRRRGRSPRWSRPAGAGSSGTPNRRASLGPNARRCQGLTYRPRRCVVDLGH